MNDDRMGPRLTAREQSVLRGLDAQISGEDPELARRLRAPQAPYGAGLSPLRWPLPVHVGIGVAFLLVGIFLGVASSILAGLVLIVVSVLRWVHRQDPVSSGTSRPEGSQRLPG